MGHVSSVTVQSWDHVCTLHTRYVCDVAVNGKLMETLDENSGNESHKMFVTFSFLIEHIY